MGIDPVSIGIQLALVAAQMAMTASQKFEGPRLDSTQFTGGDYGAALPDVWGMRRLPASIFWAEELREVKQQRKTKGGKFNDYSYFGTFAFAVAGHEIGAVRRIWLDKHLAFDLSGAGPVSPFQFTTQSGGGKGSTGAAGAWLENDYFAIYLGSETQLPDARMEATVEAEFGIGSCPAYRGTAYVVVKDLPLEKFGNRIPQIEVEVVSVSTALWLYEEVATDEGGDQLLFSPDFAVLYSGSYTGMAILDTAARATINQFPGSFSGIGTRFAPMDDGDFIALAGGTDKPYRYDVYGGLTGPANPIVNTAMRNLSSAVDVDGNSHWITKARDTTNWYFDGVDQGAGLSGTTSFADLDGNIWVLGYPDSTSVEFRQLSGLPAGPTPITVSGLPSFGGGPDGAFHFRDATHDQYIFSRNGLSYAVARADGAILQMLSSSHGTPAYHNIRSGTATFWGGFREFNSTDLSLVRYLQPSTTWGLSISSTAQVNYDPVNHALVRFGVSGPQWLYLDRVGSAGVTLQTIASDVSDRVGLTDYDYSDLDQLISGWSVTQGQASNMLEPLFDAYDSDIRPHEFIQQGLKRSGAGSGTLSTERFVSADPRYTVKLRQAAELPLAITVNFADIAADQQPNNVRSARPLDATGAKGEQSIDLTTLVLGVDDARGLADRHHRRIWNERKEIALGLTAQQLALEPGDVRVLELDGELVRARLVRLTVAANDTLASEWKYDHPSLAVIDNASGAVFDGRAIDAIIIPLLSRGFFLDLPYLSDADAQTPPIVYFGAAPLADGTWPGAVAFQALDGEYSDEIGSVPSGNATSWGYAATALPDANPNLWDRISSISVVLQTGTLSGCTEAEIDTNPLLNLCLIGDELLNFTTATLTAPLTYSLSGFKRGRRGTEWACATHAARDVFLLADRLQDAAMGLSEVGTDLSFKAITAGRTTGFPVHLTPYTGASLKPYAPCQLKAVKDAGSGDWTLSWVRRTRVGGAWTSGTTIPLSETSEAYAVEIMNGAAVVRTITGLVTPTAIWTAAQQTTDFGSGQSSVTFRVYQISDAVARGFPALLAA